MDDSELVAERRRYAGDGEPGGAPLGLVAQRIVLHGDHERRRPAAEVVGVDRADRPTAAVEVHERR